jgi:hypothetical protein
MATTEAANVGEVAKGRMFFIYFELSNVRSTLIHKGERKKDRHRKDECALPSTAINVC